MDRILLGIERLERNQPVRYRIMQLAVDTRAFFVFALMMAMLRDAFIFCFKEEPPE